MRLRGFFCLFALLFLFNASASAQNTGSIKGQLTDETGAAIPGATVTLSAGSTTRSASTGADGTFSAVGLAPGAWTVTANAFGFQPLVKQAQVAPGKAVTLAFPMQLAVAKQEVTVQEQTTGALSVDASENANQLTLSKTDLDALPDDPDDLQADLEALAGPAAGPSGPQIYIDGFTGGRMPPKDSIREIRINQNPFSAEYNQVGFGRIEILTKPGSDNFHGMALFADSDSALNSRNPFVTNKPDFYARQFDGNVSGPMNKRSSFYLDFERRNIQDNAIVNTTLIDPTTFSPYNFQQSFVVPNTRTEFGPRIDYQLNDSNTLSLRYYYMRQDEQNAGVGGPQFLTLPSQAYSYRYDENSAVITETAILSPRVVNEVRARYMKWVTKDFAASTGPSVDVLSEFNGGGSQIGRSIDAETHWELQNFTTWTAGSHSFKAGFRVREAQEGLVSPQNFGGTYTFSGGVGPVLGAGNQPVGNPMDCLNLPQGAMVPSGCTSISALEQYRRTLLFQSLGMSPQAVQLLGGMPSQFTIAAGNPLAHLSMTDVGIYIQDDWRVKQNLTVNLGLRYENQTDIRDWRDVAPRLGFAWSPGKNNKTVVRGGFGIFYDRIPDTLLLNAIKLNGTNQVQYTVANPLFFGAPPPVSTLGAASNPTIQELVRDIRAPYLLQTAFGVERQLPGNTTVAVNYANSHGVHELLDNNINAPLPGTYTGAPNSGVRPYGTPNNIYAYQSVGMFNQNQVIVSVNGRVNSALSLFSYYTLNYAKSTSDGAGSFPANPYNVAADYGRSLMDVRHRFAFGGSIITKFNLRFSPFITARSGVPFNIVTGQDVNGDSIFNDRPAFAPANVNCADATNYACTRYGNFLLHPGPNTPVIPRNYATGPSYFAINLRVSRTWGFGPETGGGAGPNGGPHGPVGGGFGGSRAMRGGFHGFGDPSTGRKYNLTFWADARNLTNSVDPANPINILESSRFGQYTGLAGGYGPAGGTANNRRLTLGIRFSF